jgi:hypothetical protein
VGVYVGVHKLTNSIYWKFRNCLRRTSLSSCQHTSDTSSRDTVLNSAECADADVWDLGVTVLERWGGHQGPWLVRLIVMSSEDRLMTNSPGRRV